MIRKLRKCKVYSCFKDDIWFDYVEDLQLKKKLIKEFVFDYAFLIFLVNMHGFFL